MEDLRVCTKFCAVLQRSRAKEDKISTSDMGGGYMIPIHSKIGQGMRIRFKKLVDWHGKNELIPINLENNISNFYQSREVKSTETQQCEQCSAVVKRVWQSSALVNPTKTLNRDAAPIGDDIEIVGRISCRCRNGK